MNSKYFLIFLIAMTFVSANDDDCKWIYRCCKEVRKVCVKMCEPEIVCDVLEDTTEGPEPEVTEEAEEESHSIPFSPFGVISVPCKKGFRMHHQGGSCKKSL